MNEDTNVTVPEPGLYANTQYQLCASAFSPKLNTIKAKLSRSHFEFISPSVRVGVRNSVVPQSVRRVNKSKTYGHELFEPDCFLARAGAAASRRPIPASQIACAKRRWLPR